MKPTDESFLRTPLVVVFCVQHIAVKFA